MITDRKQLQPLLTEITTDQWSMTPETRQKIIRDVKTIEHLQHVKNHLATPGKGQEVIEKIVKGPPYDLNEIPEKDLPYWLQAVRWFNEIIPELPTPNDINRHFQYRSMRERLVKIAGPDFVGRKQELGIMQNWFGSKQSGPLLITGIGGAGKSAIISKFILNQAKFPVLFWLDFDRPDISPDSAVSILEAINKQSVIQLTGFGGIEVNENWEASAVSLANALRIAVKGSTNPQLLVLDGFEVAQHKRKYANIWKVLKVLVGHLPGLKIIVSGRAPVRVSNIDPTEQLHLNIAGMDRESATGWLKAHNIKEEIIIEKVINISRGIPLVLRLAAKLIEKGGNAAELPLTLPVEMVEGYLYDRILDRIIDPEIKPLAKDLLVVRRVTKELLTEVFYDSIPGEKDEDEILEKLMREMSLVNETDGYTLSNSDRPGTLSLRPEVRASTLRLLEHENKERVEEINKRAVKWYLDQPLDEMPNRAELIYHLLRAGDLLQATKFWKSECAPLLADAEQDLINISLSIDGFVGKNIKTVIPSGTLAAWEQDAVNRIIDAFNRGNLGALPEVLQENAMRSRNSPLLVYDAYDLFRKGKIQEADALITGAEIDDAKGNFANTIMLAFLKRQQNDLKAADNLLFQLDVAFSVRETVTSREQFLIRAARISMNVHIEKEWQLVKELQLRRPGSAEYLDRMLSRFFTAADVLLPELVNRLENSSVIQESLSFNPEISFNSEQLETVWEEIIQEKKRNTGYSYEVLPLSLNLNAADEIWTSMLKERLNEWSDTTLLNEAVRQIILQLAVSGLKKWMLASSDCFLAHVTKIMWEKSFGGATIFALLGTIAGLRGKQLSFPGFLKSQNVNDTDHFVWDMFKNRSKDWETIPITRAAYDLAENILTGKDPGFDTSTNSSEGMNRKLSLHSFINSFIQREDPETICVATALLAPDPLNILCQSILKLPDNMQL